ncbi:MAG: hypothetical protein PF518_19900 [Spirochaetaceae bacterium]|jgi:hypothetical protein|nr:hypothetical protein [Spirochaetaceae bacterium]
MLPVDLVPLLVINLPVYRTSFGFTSAPINKKGRYYVLFKQTDKEILFCTGKYEIDDEEGKCLNFDREWKIPNGLIENYFINQNWQKS